MFSYVKKHNISFLNEKINCIRVRNNSDSTNQETLRRNARLIALVQVNRVALLVAAF